MIRILHVLGTLNRGGAETMLMNLYRKIDRTKIQFDFVIHTGENCDYTNEVYALGGKIYSVSPYRVINHFSYKKEWRDFFRDHSEYKIIHGHIYSSAAVYLKIAKKYERLTIAHSHNTNSGKGLKGIVKRIMRLPVKYVADYFLACSKEAGEWLLGEKTFRSDRSFILKNAIDVNAFTYSETVRQDVRNEFGIKDEILLGHIGRFEYQKNHQFILQILNKVLQKGLNVKMMLIGDGELRSEIEQKAREMDIDQYLIFTGVRKDVNRLLQGFDVFIFPSHFEGLGIVAIEAQAAGLPCLVSETIPKEVQVTNLVSFLPIDSSEQTLTLWVNKIKSAERTRRNTAREIIDAGYDISETIQWLSNFYSDIYQKSYGSSQNNNSNII